MTIPGISRARRRDARLVGAGLALALAPVVLPGCYEHVTDESGFTAGSTETVHEPNRTDGPVERLLYGDDEDDRRKR